MLREYNSTKAYGFNEHRGQPRASDPTALQRKALAGTPATASLVSKTLVTTNLTETEKELLQ